MTFLRCLVCKKGFYEESSIMDDMHGVLHCNVCHHETRRWRDVSRD